jgi:putative tricarboxylic transport membrane protein
MRKAEIIVAFFFVAIGIIVIVDAVRLGFRWGSSGPESGFFPFYLGVGTLICSAVVLSRGFKEFKKEGSGERLIPERGLKPILWVLIPSTMMIILTEFVGLHIAAMIFLAFYMRAVGKIGWITVALVSILLPVSLYVVFDKLFLIPLPTGLWGSKLIPF